MDACSNGKRREKSIMELHALFATGIGIANETNSLELAKKIFTDNKNIFTPSAVSENFNTTLVAYYVEKADTNKYLNENDVDQLKQVIKYNAFKFLEISGYDVNKFDLKVANFWLNEMQSESVSKHHIHYGSSLSGTYYVELPQNSEIILFRNPVELNTCTGAPALNNTPFNSWEFMLNPKEGDMVFWKSDLVHSVPAMKFDGIRKSIAFDIVITPKKLIEQKEPA
jgi:uncharacterized protein (TIGR02466 family)